MEKLRKKSPLPCQAVVWPEREGDGGWVMKVRGFVSFDIRFEICEVADRSKITYHSSLNFTILSIPTLYQVRTNSNKMGRWYGFGKLKNHWTPPINTLRNSHSILKNSGFPSAIHCGLGGKKSKGRDFRLPIAVARLTNFLCLGFGLNRRTDKLTNC